MKWFKRKNTEGKITDIENHELLGMQTGKSSIVPGTWYNIKNSEAYEVIDLDVINATNELTGQRTVLYRDKNGQAYVWNFSEFICKFTPCLGWRLPTMEEVISLGMNKPPDSGTSYADLGKEDLPIQTWVKP